MSSKVQNICDLPEHALENIFKYLSYDEIAKNRMVVKIFLCFHFMLNVANVAMISLMKN